MKSEGVLGNNIITQKFNKEKVATLTNLQLEISHIK